MPSSSQDIQTYDGGPGYKHWATEVTLEKILDLLKKQGIDPNVINSLSDSLDQLNDNGKVDTESLRKVLANLKTGTDRAKERDKTAEDLGKKQEGFWAKSNSLGKQAARAFKDANIKDHLKGAGDMFLMPVESMSDAFVKVAGVVGAFGAGLSNAVTAVIDKLKIFGGKLGSVLKGAMGMVGWIAGGLTTVVGGLIGIVEQLGDSFFDMYDTGINFAKGLDDSQTGLGAMANAAANARLTIGEFAEFITENSRVAVAIGAESMGALSNSVRGALYPLGNLGLTAAETNEHLGEYLEVQRTLGVLDTMSRSQRARASSEYLVQLTMMAQITGKRRKQIAADMKQAMDQTSLTAWMLTLSAEEKQQALKNTQAITGVLASIDPAAGAAFNEALGKGGMGLTDWGRSLMQAGYTNEVAALDNLRLQVERGEITEQQAQKETLRIMRMMRDNEGAAQALRELARTGDGAADQAVKLISGLQGAELSMDAWSKRLGGAEKGIGSWDEMQRSVSQTWTNFIAGLFGDDDFSEGINAFMGEFQKILAPDGDFAKTIATFARDAGPALVKAIQSLGNAMPDVISWIKKLPDTLKSLWDSLSRGIAAVRSIFFDQVYNIDTGETEWVAKDMGKVMDEMWGKITDKLIEGAKNLPWGKIAIAIAAIFAGKAFLGMIGRKMMGGGAVGALGGVGGGVAAPALGAEQTKGGSLGKNVGGFVGGIAEGVMKGAAAGLAAFGKAGPAVVKGATLLGLAIAAIATGIAGAQWILSKTMGPFADSLKGFTELDGDALIKTGLGMSAIGVGLTAMGAGGVINAIGNLVGAGFEALGNLLGVKGPLERLREFGEAGKDIDAEGVKKTAEAMAAFSKAMAMGGASTAITGIGTLVGGIANALGKLFGAKDPLTQLRTFGNTRINAAGVKINADAMKAFAQAMKDAPTIKGERSGGVFGFIASLFAGNIKMPWDQVKDFGRAEIDGPGVAKNARAMTAFALAMKDAPVIEGKRSGGLFGAIAFIFAGSIKMPWDQVKSFAEADMGNTANLEKNAKAMAAFGKAIQNLPEKIEGTRGGGLLGAVAFIFKGSVKMPWDQVKSFAEADLGNTTNLKKNAEAMAAFGTAMSTMPDKEINGERVGGIMGAVAFIFKGKVKMPWDQVKDFSEADLGNTTNLKKNAEAMSAFGNALSTMPEKIEGTRGGGIMGAVAAVFTGGLKMPWDQVKDFADADLGNTANISKNAKAMSAFGNALSTMPEKIEGTRGGGLLGFVAGLFVGGVKMPWDQVKDFANADMGNATKLASNAVAMSAFSDAMAGAKQVPAGDKSGGWLGKVAGFFTGAETMPWDQVKIFGAAEIDANGVIANAKAMSAFALAMGNVDGEALKNNVNELGDIKSGSWTGLTSAMTTFQAIDSTKLDAAGASITKLTAPMKALAEALPKDIKNRLKDFGAGMEQIADYLDDDELTVLGEFADHMAKLGPILGREIPTLQGTGHWNRPVLDSSITTAELARSYTGDGTMPAVATVADLENVGGSITGNINAEMLTSANNRETILSEIKVILQELSTNTIDASTIAKRSADKQRKAIIDASEWAT